MSVTRGKPPMVYRLFLWVVSPLLVLHTLWRSAHGGGQKFRRQRLGVDLPQIDSPVIWIHAASVGEVQTVSPLLRLLRESHPGVQLLLTTTTPTGHATLERLELERVTIAYLPLDFNRSIQRFYRRLNLRCGLIVETEIWPHLFHLSPAPLCMINARLSHRTLNAARGWAADTYRKTLQIPALIAARSETDAQAYRTLGAPEQTIRIVGNLKFAGASVSTSAPSPIIAQRYCLLASTHHDEELQLSNAWLEQHREELLVIVPRHPERGVALQKQLASDTGVNATAVALRSQHDPVDSTTRIYIADTLGELQSWYAHAGAILIGGSLIERGGHNMLEAAAVAKSVVCGPHTFNFNDEVKLLHQQNAIVTATTATACVAELIRHLDHPESCRQAGLRAQAAVSEQTDMAERYLELLTPWLRPSPPAQVRQ